MAGSTLSGTTGAGATAAGTTVPGTMSAGSLECSSCGFHNPRAWRACARCGHLLSSAVATSQADITSPDQTSVGPAPSFDDLEDEHTLTDTRLPTILGERSTAPEEVEPPLIGQGAAAEIVRANVERGFREGTPTLTCLEGERGSGKTRLLMYASEIAARVAPNVRIFYGTCREGGDGPYAPFARLLLERFNVTPSSAPTAVRGQMATMVGDALSTTDAFMVAETTHLLGHVAGVPFPASPILTPLEGQPDELRRRAGQAVRRLFEGESQKWPILVLLDNMDHAGEHGWELLASTLAAGHNVVVVAAGAAGIAARARAVVGNLGVAQATIAPFGEADVASMLLVLMPNLGAPPEPLVAAVTHRSRGNPSAVRELVLELLESGLFVSSPEGPIVDLARLEAGGLPVTMHDVVRARLKRLDTIERATLDRAAICGETFWEGALLAQMRSERAADGGASDAAALWPDDEDERTLRLTLTRLEDKGFIVARNESDLPGAKELAFHQNITRSLVYEEQAPELRTSRHAIVAQWLAVIAELRREGVAAMIAPHLERAGLHARAGRAYLEAAAYERFKLQTSMALRYVERALPLIDPNDVARKIDALHEHGSLLTTLGRYDEAITTLTSMLRLAWQVGARNKGGAALNRVARVYRQRGEIDRAEALLHRSLELFREAGDKRGVASGLDDLAQIQRLRGQVAEAEASATEALQIRRAHDDARGEAVSLSTLGHCALDRGDLESAERFLHASLTLRTQIGDQEGIMQSQNGLGVLAVERGDVASAIQAFSAVLENARTLGDFRTQTFALANLGEAYLLSGDVALAFESLSEARGLADQLGDVRAQADVMRNLGLCALRRNDEGAEELLFRALALAESYGAKEAVALAHRAIGQLRSRTLFDASGSVDKRGEESYLASIDLFREIGSDKEAARSLAELGHHLIERGDLETARERLREARAVFRKMGLPAGDKVDQTLRELGG